MAANVAVIGAGVTGLLLARAMTSLGYEVVVIESGDRLCSGATGRNEGWLHHGTYHAVSIDEVSGAVAVAKRCIYGASRIVAIAPEAIEEPFSLSFAWTADNARVAEVEDRWRSAGVFFERVPLNELSSALPPLRTTDVAQAYRVAEKAINTRTLCSVILAGLVSTGTPIFLSATARSWDNGILTVETPTGLLSLESDFILMATGAGTNSLARALQLKCLPSVRYWASHLISARRFLSGAAISLDQMDVTAINHGSATVIGLNGDAVRIDTPIRSPSREGAQRVLDAVAWRLNHSLAESSVVTACTKVDLVPVDDDPRSLAPTAMALDDRVIALLPGKMSEAPYVVDRAASIVAATLGFPLISSRAFEGLAAQDGPYSPLPALGVPIAL